MLDATTWLPAVEAARREGFTYYDLLTAHDELGRSHHIVITLRLRDLDTGEVRVLSAAVSRDDATVPDISHLFAGAAWGQRYVHDFFGVRFAGADLRPLLYHGDDAPLCKDVVLATRDATPHPAGEVRGRRRR